MTKRTISVYVTKANTDLSEDEKLKWFMNNYGLSIGQEVACACYNLVQQGKDKGKDLFITIE